MARQKEHDLYQELINSKFSFVPKGRINIEEIYESVSTEFPKLCDNTYYCSENCNSGNNQPEWKHTVRNALQKLKNTSTQISFTGQRGFWKFE